MIDFHTHILHNMDDGAENIKISVSLVNSLIKQGVNRIVLTPHFYFYNIATDNFLLQREKNIKELEDLFKGQDIKFIPSCEVHISRNRLTQNLNKFAISGTNYILIELANNKIFSKKFIDNIADIKKYTGLTPIIAHAERYYATRHFPQYISTFINKGCLIQLNADSLFNERTKRLAYCMLKYNQVHILGTDCHNLTKRPPLYEKAVQEIKNTFGEDYFLKLQQNMIDVLENKNLTITKTKPIKRFLKKYF